MGSPVTPGILGKQKSGFPQGNARREIARFCISLSECVYLNYRIAIRSSYATGTELNLTPPATAGMKRNNLPIRQTFIEPWYLSYALLGVSAAGVLPILLPLAVSNTGSITDVGLVIASFNLGGLVSPLWGTLADRYRLHRLLLTGGLLVTAATIASFPGASSLASRSFLAFLQGAGAAAAATVANLFIVELHPEREWDKRIGWLQTFYGSGQVVGLLLAGVLTKIPMHIGLFTTAGLTAVACFPAWFMTPKLTGPPTNRPILRHPVRHAEVHAGSPQRFYHLPSLHALQKALRPLLSPFGLFIISWLISFMGVAAFFSLYPVLMKSAYGVDPATASGAFAVSAALGLALYPAAGKWSETSGAARMLQLGFAMRILAFIGFLSFGAVRLDGHFSLALVDFLFIVLAWSLLSVGGTAMASELSRSNEGEGLGLYNATTSIAGVIGAVLGGWLAGRFGFDAVEILGLVSVIAGLILITIVPNIRRQDIDFQQPQT